MLFQLLAITAAVFLCLIPTPAMGSAVCLCPLNQEMDVYSAPGENKTIMITAVNTCTEVVGYFLTDFQGFYVNVSGLVSIQVLKIRSSKIKPTTLRLEDNGTEKGAYSNKKIT